MVLERLENSRWGFDTNCFACEPSNEAGLRIPFFVDRERGVVTAEFSLDDRFSGTPTYLHGGVVLTVLDEAMAWATIALATVFAVTKETTTRFRAPVLVGSTYAVVARVDEDRDTDLRCSAEVVSIDGTVCTTAIATFVPLGPAEAPDAIGAELGADAVAHLRSAPAERQPDTGT